MKVYPISGLLGALVALLPGSVAATSNEHTQTSGRAHSFDWDLAPFVIATFQVPVFPATPIHSASTTLISSISTVYVSLTSPVLVYTTSNIPVSSMSITTSVFSASTSPISSASKPSSLQNPIDTAFETSVQTTSQNRPSTTINMAFSTATPSSTRRPIDYILKPPVKTISQDTSHDDPYAGMPQECLYSKPFEGTFPTWCHPLMECADYQGVDKSLSCDHIWRENSDQCGDPAKLNGDSWCKVWYNAAIDRRAVSGDGKHHFFNDLPKKCHIQKLIKSRGKHAEECKRLIRQKAKELGIPDKQA